MSSSKVFTSATGAPAADNTRRTVVLGLTLVFNILMGGALTGAAFNPARALGPMIVTGNLGDAWLYGLAPIVGAIIAAIVHMGLSLLTHERPGAVAAPAE